MKTIEQLSQELPYSELELIITISNQVDYVIEGTDEWGYKTHLTSGIEDTFQDALQAIQLELFHISLIDKPVKWFHSGDCNGQFFIRDISKPAHLSYHIAHIKCQKCGAKKELAVEMLEELK